MKKLILTSILAALMLTVTGITSSVSAASSNSCSNVYIANISNYDLSQPSQPWVGAPQVSGFSCVTADGSNPGPWRLALFSGETIIAQSPSNGKSLSPSISQAPSNGSYTLRCIQVQGDGSEKPVNTTCPGIELTAQSNSVTGTPAKTPTTTTKVSSNPPKMPGTRATNSNPTLEDIRKMPIVANNLDKKVGGKRVADRLQGSRAQRTIQSTPASLISSFLEIAQSMSCSEIKNPSQSTLTEVTTQLAAVSPDGGPLTGAISMDNAKYVKRLKKAFKIFSKFQCQ